ncbi:MAG: DUF4375 domain-containing protein [Erysipelotrichaceae bacterium]|nr:DUF4375 domain-containing protein [Erysipelotrichaceae bacterium]
MIGIEQQNMFRVLCSNIWERKFSKNWTEKYQDDIDKLMYFLVTIDEDKKFFLSYMNKDKSLPGSVVAIIFASFHGYKRRANKKYKYLLNSSTSSKWKDMLVGICNKYNIIFSMDDKKICLSFPENFKNIISCSELEIKSYDKWNKFVEWWSNCDENLLEGEDKFVYQFMWYHNEVCNGGHDQFFDNKNDWNLKETDLLFKQYLPKEIYDNFHKAYLNSQKGKDCSLFDEKYNDEEIEKILEEIANNKELGN